MNPIQDYLQTQAIALDHEDIAIALTATQTVLANAQAHIDNHIVQHEHLPKQLDLATIKQLFIALDSMYSRHTVQTAVVYALTEHGDLLRIAQRGKPVENALSVNEDNAWRYLAVRTAQSGWANIAEDVAKWLQIGELQGEHNRRATSQTSLPICGEDGIVYGVLHLEHTEKQPENALADWVGFALGILPTLATWFPRETTANEA